MSDKTWRSDPRIEATFYAVEANSFESLVLWEEWNETIRWESDSWGRLIGLGEFAGHPVNLSVKWARLDGHLVCFYEAVSRVVDYEMVDKWLDERGWKKTDAMNFSHCIRAIAKRTGKQYKPKQ